MKCTFPSSTLNDFSTNVLLHIDSTRYTKMRFLCWGITSHLCNAHLHNITTAVLISLAICENTLAHTKAVR